MAIHDLQVLLLIALCCAGLQICILPMLSQVLSSQQEPVFLLKYLEQKLDHFNAIDSGTFSQRYFENKTFYDGSGNFFLLVGGESNITEKWMNNGEWYRLAEKHGAATFFLEHRYYGESRPYKNISTPNLRYLSSKNAVEDIALFITKINKEYNVTATSPKWILFGGSYAGSLAVWSRLKYPHLIRGVVASSAPLLAKLDFHEYYEVVTESLKTYNDQCVTDIRTAIGDLDNYLSEKNVEAINSTFKFCNNLSESWDDSKNVTMIFIYIAVFFGKVVQNDINKMHEVCDYMTNKNNGVSEVKRLSGLLKKYNEKCILSYKDYVTIFKTEVYTEGSFKRLWLYQTCTEFGFFQTLNESENQVFGNRVPLDFLENQCVDVFGPEFNLSVTKKGIEYSNRFGGQKNIEISNVVLVNGKLDPWHQLGIYETQQKDPVVIFISDTTHCADMETLSKGDSEEVKIAKKKVETLVAQWLQGNPETSGTLLILLVTILIGLGIGVVICHRRIITDCFTSTHRSNEIELPSRSSDTGAVPPHTSE